jgi:hypothetical protein
MRRSTEAADPARLPGLPTPEKTISFQYAPIPWVANLSR